MAGSGGEVRTDTLGLGPEQTGLGMGPEVGQMGQVPVVGSSQKGRSSASLRILRGRRPSGANSFHATPIGVVLKSKNIG